MQSFLKKLRESFGLSKAEFAKRVGLSGPYIGQIENGKRENLSKHAIRAIVETFGVAEQWLVSGVTDSIYARGLQKTMREQGVRPEELSEKLDLPLKFVEGIICGEIGPADDLFVRMIESIGGNEQKYPRKQSTRESKLAGPPPDGYQVVPQSERVEKLRTQLDTCYERYFDLQQKYTALERECEKLRGRK